MSSLGIFDKETKTYKKVAGTAEAAVVDDALSPTSTNPVQNKVVKAYVDKKVSENVDFSTSTSKLLNGTVEAPLVLSKATRNLLIPDLQTVTKNGITCTNNGDGTYTFNGTATNGTFFDINRNIPINKGTTYKVVCLKDEDYIPNDKIISSVRRVDIENAYIFNNGPFVSDTENCWLFVKIEKDVTVSNLVAKPIITTDLNATYYDFVPYSGYDIKTCGKNVFDLSKIDLIDVEYGNGVYTNKITDSKTYFNAYIDYWNDDSYINSNRDVSISADAKGRYSITGKIPEGCTKIRFKHNGTIEDIDFFLTPISYFGLKVGDTFTISIDVDGYNPSTAGGLIVKNIQIEKGSTATEYEHYQDGGTVHIDSTTEFPLLGLKSFDGETNILSQGNVEVTYAKSDSGKAILDMSENKLDKDNVVNNQTTTDEGYTLDARQANPNVEGSLGSQIKAVTKNTTVNLLKPTLQTTTINGVTCTNNGDGTYTLNGTVNNSYLNLPLYNAGEDISDDVVGLSFFVYNEVLADTSIVLYTKNNNISWDNENRLSFSKNTIKYNDNPIYGFGLVAEIGATFDNVLIKPMLTTDLSATYDDFVPYTGDTGKLNGDVAELKAEIANNKTATAGSATQPVYFSGGKPVACSHTLDTSVPSNAVFTDTKVTNTLDKNTKAYVTGTTSASTNTGPQIFDTGVYLGIGTGQLILEGSSNYNYPTDSTVLDVKIPPSSNHTYYGINIEPYRKDMTDYITGLNINCGESTGPGMIGIDVTCSVDTYEPTVYINRSGGTNSYALQVPNGKSYIATIYSNSSTITTSDREKKTDIKSISDKYEELFFKLQPRLFKFKDGTSGRIHIGAIAQEVEEALKEVGISDTDFAGFVRQEKEYVVNKETGEITQEEGYDYYLRYEEFVMLLCHMLQKLYAEKEEQDNKISDLESRIVALESKLG